MSETLRVSAERLGTSFALDPEMAIPSHPRLIPELVILPYGKDGMLFDGVRDLQVIVGRSTRGFLPRLFPLLDGTRSLAELHKHFPALAATALRDAVALLYSRGLLESGSAAVTQTHSSDVDGFLGRFADVTRVNRSRGEARVRLATQRIAVAATAGGDEVAAALAGEGFAAVERLDCPTALTPGVADLLVVVAEAGELDTAAWFAAASDAGIRALHACVGTERVEVGPYFIPGASGCYECFRRLQPEPSGAGAHDLPFWAAALALHAFNVASRIGPVKLFNVCHVHRRTDAGPLYDRRVVARLPGCARCGLKGTELAPDMPENEVWVLHHAPHNMTCKELRSPRDHQIHYAAKNLKLTGKAPQPRHGAASFALDASAPLDSPPPWTLQPPPRARVDLALLGQMLHHAAGYQHLDGALRRIAPSGGGLGSADLYLVVRKLEGLAPGAYHYFGWGHTLERIGVVPDPVLAGALGIAEAELPPVLVVGTSDLRKTRQKYDEFAFRIGHLDAGVARQFIGDIAGAAGIRLAEYADARDAVLTHLLRLPVAGNRIMQSFAVGLGDPFVDGEAPDALCHHHHTTDTLIAMCGRYGPVPRHVGEPPAYPPVHPHALGSLGDLMAARRSVREFSGDGVPFGVLRSMAALAADAARRRVHASGLFVDMGFWMLVARSGQETPRGIYRWDDHSGTLTLHRAGLTDDEQLATMQQHGYAEAAVTCFVTANLDAALTRHGPRGYREAVSRAGSMLARLQVAALSWGVEGSMWGGLADEGVGRLLGIDRLRDCPLFAASFGHPR